VVSSAELLPLIRELFSRSPEYRYLEAWELQTLLWSLGYTDELEDEVAIDKLIDARYSPEDDRMIAEAWAESARNMNLRAQAGRRREWVAHYRRVISVHEELAERNRQLLARHIDESGRRSNA
jgi:hypothetical protein